MVAFDAGFAETQGIPVARIDLAIMALVMAITVVGLKVVGLILIVALLIVPAATARFWTNKADRVVLLAGLFGGVSGYSGAAISATAPDLPTGPIIVLVGFAVFTFSLLFSPDRGVLASMIRHLRFQRQVHMRQGLLSLALGQPIYERRTRNMLMGKGLMRADGVATSEGRAQANAALRDESRWQALRSSTHLSELSARDDGLTEIEDVLTSDQIADLDRRIGGPRGVVT
jgi:manganese/zinc/iron transport system permease protein